MADVFISHHTKSAGEIAEKISDDLNKYGISCFIAQRDIKGGVYAGEITRAIRECKIFLLLLNDDAQKSGHVLNEINIAFSRYNKQKDIVILPFKIGYFDLNDNVFYYLNTFQINDGTGLPEKSALEKLAGRVRNLLNEFKGENLSEYRAGTARPKFESFDEFRERTAPMDRSKSRDLNNNSVRSPLLRSYLEQMEKAEAKDMKSKDVKDLFDHIRRA